MTEAAGRVRRVAFDVDLHKLLQMMRTMGGDTSALGARLVSCLTADPSLPEQIGMAAYGVTLVGPPDPDAPAGEDGGAL